MSSDLLNDSEAFRSSDGKGFVRSVSIIFYISNHGYLLCSEMRKGFPNPKVRNHEDHMIGGKVDIEDTSTLECGFREFCEETGYRCLNDEGQSCTIEDSVNIMAYKFEGCLTYRWDYCVSPKKFLYNRFYVIKLDDCSDFEFFTDFIDYVKSWEKSSDLPLESLYFWNNGDTFEHQPSSLLKTFIENLPDQLDSR